jgi:GH15 family glucan-1,4-alpha-glucosidase
VAAQNRSAMEIDRARLIARTARERRTFTQYYRFTELDAGVLTIPLLGFLPGTDERVSETIGTVWRELGHDGFVSRYSTAETDDVGPFRGAGSRLRSRMPSSSAGFVGSNINVQMEGRLERDGIYGRAR